MCVSNVVAKANSTRHFLSTYFLEICWRNTTASTETLGHNSALHITSYLSIAFSKILPHSITIKNAKKLLVFGENDSHFLSNLFHTYIF